MALSMKGELTTCVSVGLLPMTCSGLRDNHIHGCTDVQQETFNNHIVRTWVDQEQNIGPDDC